MNFFAASGLMPIEWCGFAEMISSRESFAEGLARLIRRSGKTQKEIAEELGINTSSISRWLKARELPNSVTIDKLCTYFGVHPMMLFAADETIAIGQGKIVVDLEKLAADSGFKLTPKDS
jgi:transcriptional regulator with XRE-family HTH domain